jgi:putative FmdB family regulatory protein
MPIYEFKCAQCGREFETLVVSAREEISCPGCGSGRCGKLLSSFRSPGGRKGQGEPGDGYAGSGSGCGSCSAPSCSGCGSR